MDDIKVSEVATTLGGLRARRYYIISDKDDPVIRILEEIATELDIPLTPKELDSSLLETLRAAEHTGADIPNLDGRTIWKETILNEVPQGE